MFLSAAILETFMDRPLVRRALFVAALLLFTLCVGTTGFQLIEPPSLSPQIVDWDELDAERVSVVPQRSRQKRRSAA